MSAKKPRSQTTVDPYGCGHAPKTVIVRGALAFIDCNPTVVPCRARANIRLLWSLPKRREAMGSQILEIGTVQEVKTPKNEDEKKMAKPAVAGKKRAAPIALLSPAKRMALVECFNSDGLHKQKGCWRASSNGQRISGATVADLSRDGMVKVVVTRHSGLAKLTERGIWFAQSLVEDACRILDHGS
jgi:hypothetical protein